MKISYSRDEDILMLELANDMVVDHAEQVGPVIAHFTDSDQLVLLEILDATEFFSAAIKATARGLATELPT